MYAAAGINRRVIITVPPRHGKSETASHWFPVWLLGNFPHMRVVLCSYEATFAASWSRKVRDSLTQARALGLYAHGPRDDLGAASVWETDAGGGMISAGVGGPITGRGANLLIIDDPVKNAEEANSPTYREKTWEWYTTTAYTRLEPRGIVVVIQTRWHIDDLAGRILSPDYSAPQDIADWRVINLPALAEDNDPLGRAPGEALWPERYPVEELEKSKRILGSYGFAALYQQRPAPREGGMFKRHWFEIVDAAPSHGDKARGWDLAGTADGGDYTVGVRGVKNGRFYIDDVRREQLGPAGVRDLIRVTAQQDGKHVRISVPQDPGQAGKAQAQEFAKLLAGYIIHATPETGPKHLRAEAFAAQCEAGNVALVRGPWNEAFIDEFCSFNPDVKDQVDDQVDATSRCFTALTGAGLGGISAGHVAREA